MIKKEYHGDIHQKTSEFKDSVINKEVLIIWTWSSLPHYVVLLYLAPADPIPDPAEQSYIYLTLPNPNQA